MARKPTRPHLDPDDVIAGRARPPARDLIDLIRDVNPTGRDLPAKDVVRRYSQKSRLQSLLIRRFAEDLVVAPDPHEPGVVSLRHRPLHTSACHALVCELDEDARSWVQLQLDLASAPVEAPRAEPRMAAHPGAVDHAAHDAPDPLRAGQDAIDAYDYDLARAHLLQALDLPGAGADVAVALLSLLVDHLAADHEALALKDRLPAPVRSRPEVRELLALAAARSGDRARALGLLGAPHGTRAAEIFLALARAALEAGDLQGAADDLVRVRAQNPTHHELPGLAQLLAARRAAERQPMEEDLARLLDEGRIDDAEVCGRQILARWPDSAAGRRALRAIEEMRRVDTAKQLLAAADEALSRGDLVQARSSLARARAAGASSAQADALERRLVEAEEAGRDRAERAAEERVVSLLARDDPGPGLVAYLALSPRQRMRAQQRAPLPRLGWLAEMAPEPVTGARARAAVLAADALDRAAVMVASEPHAALDLLAAQGKILHDVSRSAEIASEAHAQLDALRREAARRRLDSARAAFEGDDVDGTAALLADVAIADLPEPDRVVAEDLELGVARARERRRMVATFEKQRRQGAILAARQVAGSLAERAEGEERARWSATCDELDAEIVRAFRLHLDRTAVPFTSLRELDLPVIPGVQRTLLPGSREMLVVQTLGVRVFLRVIDLASRTIRARVLLRTPQPVEILSAEVGTDRMILFGRRGVVLGLRIPGFRVDLYAERIGVAALGDTFVEAVFVPGTAFLWVVLHPEARSWVVRIVDLTSGRPVRELRESCFQLRLRVVPGLAEPIVAVVRHEEDGLSLHDARGVLLERGKYDLGVLPESVVAAPSGDRIFLCTGPRRPSDLGRRTLGGWCSIVPGGRASPEAPLASLGEVDVFATTDHQGGSIYLHCESAADAERQLLGVRLTASDPPALEVVFHARVPGRNMLLEAWGGGPVTALASHEDGIEVTELGAAPPVFRPGPAAGRLSVGRLLGFQGRCYQPTGARDAAVQALAAAMKSEPRAGWARRYAATRQENNADRLVTLVHALMQLHETGDAWGIVAWAAERHPDHPELRLFRARVAANGRRWAEVVDLLGGVDVSTLDDGSGQHVHHLLGIALLFVGRHEEALRLLRLRAASPGGRCDLAGLLALALPAAEEATASEAAAWSPDQLFLRDMVRAVTAADVCLAQGDAAGALVALDCLAVAEAHEVQSLARRAEATLLLGDMAEGRRFETAFALASFCEAHAETGKYDRQELPLPCGIWDAVRLDGLAERANRWLDAALGEAWPMPPGGL